MSDDLVSRAKIKAQMLRMGEPVAFGSDADVIDELVVALTKARSDIERLREALEQIAGDLSRSRAREVNQFTAACERIGAVLKGDKYER